MAEPSTHTDTAAMSVDTMSVYGYHQIPDERDDETVARGFLDCFNTPAGHIVLNRLYWGYVMAATPEGEKGQRHQGKVEMFKEIIDMMQKGELVRRSR